MAGRNKGRSSRSFLTALGRSTLLRTYFACPGCGLGGAHVDRLLGLAGFLTRQTTRLICLTGSRAGFVAAAGSDHIGATLASAPDLSGHAALAELAGYFAAHTERLNYAHHLHTGASIGSGMVEGSAKNLIGKRMKQTGARWVVADADAMAGLCGLSYSDQWDLYRAPSN